MLNDESRMRIPTDGNTRSAGDRPGNIPEGTSEVARLRRLIAAEYEAAQRGLTGLSQGTAKHAFIEARMNRHVREYRMGMKIDDHFVCSLGRLAPGALGVRIRCASWRKEKSRSDSGSGRAGFC